MAKIENNRWVGGKKDIQIQTKLIGLVGGVILVASVAVAAVSLVVFDKNQVAATEAQLLHSAEGAQRVSDDWLVTLKTAASISARRSDVVEATYYEDKDMFKEIVDTYTEDLDYEYMAFVNKSGVVIYGGADGFAQGKDLSSNYAVKKALTGEIAYCFAPIGDTSCGATYAYPIKDDDGVLGAAVFVYDMTTDDFVSLMQASYDCECTIFVGDLRAKSTISGVEGTVIDNREISRRNRSDKIYHAQNRCSCDNCSCNHSYARELPLHSLAYVANRKCHQATRRNGDG